jgi:hypothetical protein
MSDHKMHNYENTHVPLKEETANILGLAFSYINVRDQDYRQQLAAQ